MAFAGTSTALTGNSTYTGPTFTADRDDSIVGSVASDQSGSLFIEQSADGINWDIRTTTNITGSGSAGTGTIINTALVLPFWRVRYTNGATNQGSFRLSIRSASAGSDD